MLNKDFKDSSKGVDEDGSLICLKSVSKVYTGSEEVVLNGIDLEIAAGETVAIVGPSGCGKSTLLNLMGTLDEASSGGIFFQGTSFEGLDARALATLRNTSIGFVFQSHHLLPQCTALENVLIPTLVNGTAAEARVRAEQLLTRVGLADRMHHTPAKLSGGERQRVAVVRALINRPVLLLADEPTGSLSTKGSEELVQLLIELNEEEGMTLVVATHAPAVAAQMGRTLELNEGRFV